MFRNPFRDRRKFKLGWRSEYPRIELNSPERNLEKEFPDNRISTTKYSAFSYLPKVLFHEFKKFTSAYFLIVAIITLFPSIAPFSPWTSIGGLLFILAVSMFREAVEDFLLLRADAKVNGAQFFTLLHLDPPLPIQEGQHDTIEPQYQPVACADLRVGDIVYLQTDDLIPADLLLLSSGSLDSSSYIETAQLDGETNLKM